MSRVTKTHYQAKYDYEATGKGQLNIKVGDKFVLVSKTGDEWWTVRSSDGNLGLVPASYLEPFEEKEEDALPKAAGYVTLYEFTGQDSTQLSFKQGETLYLVDKTDHSWWSMRGEGGKVGLVPVNYIDKAENAKLENGPETQVNGKSEAEVFREVMLSIDNAMEKIHSDATKQGGSYTSEQRASLQRLVTHRKTVVEGNKDHTSSPDPASFKRLSPTKLSPSSPRRQAPLPPAQAGTKTASSTSPKSASNKKDNRLSLQVDSLDRAHHPGGGVMYGSLPRRSAPRPPQRRESLGDRESDPRFPQRSLTVSGARPTQQEPFLSSASTVQPQQQQQQKSSNLKAHSPDIRRHSTDTGVSSHTQNQRPHSAHAVAASASSKSPKTRHKQDATRKSSGSKHSSSSSASTSAGSPKKQKAGAGGSSGSPSRQMRRTHSASTTGSRHDSISEEAPVPAAAPVPTSPQKREEPPRVELPTAFVASDGADLVEVVRVRTGMSYNKSLLAVGGVLEFLKNRVEACSEMVDALLTAVQQSQTTTSPRSARKLEGSSDLERLKEIFFELTECKDDSQQRGWAVHDDQDIITEYLDELLQILCDADPSVTKVAVQEDKYENVLTLITYYQMEARVPIRLLLLKVFGVLCGLDTTVVSVLLTSVLPNELGRDIQDNLTADLQKTLYSSTVSVMVFSTGEAVPLPVYDQWTKEFVLFLLDTIESPPEEDVEDQVPDAFLNMILSYNQHFQDPSTNLVIRALRERPNPRNFSEKLMFLVNRGEDPVAISEPCCPDSITKFLMDVFADKSTSGMFYTTDMMVLIDIVTRQLTDLGPGEETRTHYLDLFNRIVTTTNYPEHKHRQKDLSSCFNRIAQEEHADSQRDHEMIKKIWITFPGMFEEVTDL